MLRHAYNVLGMLAKSLAVVSMLCNVLGMLSNVLGVDFASMPRTL